MTVSVLRKMIENKPTRRFIHREYPPYPVKAFSRDLLLPCARGRSAFSRAKRVQVSLDSALDYIVKT
jgi:hypothetical protein